MIEVINVVGDSRSIIDVGQDEGGAAVAKSLLQGVVFTPSLFIFL